MLPRSVSAVFRKELADALRDRRTLFVSLFVPVLLYPVLLLSMSELFQYSQAQMRREVYLVGVREELLPFFAERLPEPQDGPAQPETAAPDSDARKTGPQAGAASGGAAQQEPLRPVGPNAGTPRDRSPLMSQTVVKLQVQAVDPEEGQRRVKDGTLAVYIDLPVDALERLAGGLSTPLHLYFDRADHRSDAARAKVAERIAMISRELVDARLKEKQLTRDLISPFKVTSEDLATPEKRSGSVQGTLLPILLVMMAVMGALHPAIDMTAGERERSTLETLIAAPVTPLAIVMGKFLAVGTLALGSVILNVCSFRVTLLMVPGPAEMQLSWSLVPLVILVLVPLVAFCSALLLALSSLAANQKEAQVYCMPVLFLPMLVVGFVMVPGLELSGPLLIAPFLNAGMLIKELCNGRGTLQQVLIVITSMGLYTGAALTAAARLFAREEVLFSTQPSLRLFLSRRFLQPQPLPKAGDAVLVVALLFPLNFFLQTSLSSVLIGEGRELGAGGFALLVLLPQFLLFLGLPLLAAWYLKIGLSETFLWRRPAALHLLGAVLLGSSSWVLAQQLVAWQARVWPYNPAEFAVLEGAVKNLLALPGGAALLVLLIGVVPAVCEEHLFRGFFLQGLRNAGPRLGAAGALLACAVVFGLYHLPVFRQPVVMLLGLFLAWVAWSGRSIWPAILFHALHNGFSAVAAGYLPRAQEQMLQPAEGSGAAFDPAQLDVAWPWLVAAGFVFACGCAVIRTARAGTERYNTSPLHEESVPPA